MAKKITGYIKLQIPAGKATPGQPIGPALGQHGLNIMEFCKAFNARTQKDAAEAMIIPVIITVFSDRTFTFITKLPPVPNLIKREIGLQKGTKNHKEKVGKITAAQVEKIAKFKMPDLNCTDVQSAARQVAGTARSMGILVEG